MPTFDTPEPISVTIDLAVGDVRITASDRSDTVVDVRPSDAANDEDVKAAEQTRVEFANGQLLVKAPKLRQWLSRSGGGSIDVTIELPAGSDVHGTLASGTSSCEGRLGDCRLQDRPRRHQARRGRPTLNLEARRRRHHRRARDGPRRDHDRLRRRARPRDRRQPR